MPLQAVRSFQVLANFHYHRLSISGLSCCTMDVKGAVLATLQIDFAQCPIELCQIGSRLEPWATIPLFHTKALRWTVQHSPEWGHSNCRAQIPPMSSKGVRLGANDPFYVLRAIWNLDRRCIWWVAHLGTSLLPGNSGLLWCAGNLDHPRIESGSSLFTSVLKNPGLSTINKYSESPRGTEPKFQIVSIATRQGWSNKRSRISLLIHRLLPENSIEIEQTDYCDEPSLFLTRQHVNIAFFELQGQMYWSWGVLKM